MNKIIPALSITVLCGCSTAHVKTSALAKDFTATLPSAVRSGAPIRKYQPAAYLANNHQFQKIKSTYDDIASAYDSAETAPTAAPQDAEPTQQEEQPSLFPRIASYIKKGLASWYGPRFHGKKTANGEIFDMYALTAAHKTLPIPSYAEVTNLKNNRKVIVRINDRGPFVGNRLLDLSYAAAKELAINGVGQVEIKAIPARQAIRTLKKIAKEQRSSELYLQVGLFTSSRDAHIVRSKIAARHLADAKVLSSAYLDSKLYAVRVGPMASKAQAEQVNQQLAKLGITATYALTENKQNESVMVQ